MGNECNIYTFSLRTIPKIAHVSPPVEINVKQCMVCKIFFIFQWWHQKKSLETTALDDASKSEFGFPQCGEGSGIKCHSIRLFAGVVSTFL
jgi:hypothetical protein